MIIRTSIAEPGMFDTFVIIDWSAANQPNTGRDSIWICAVDRDGVQAARAEYFAPVARRLG